MLPSDYAKIDKLLLAKQKADHIKQGKMPDFYFYLVLYKPETREILLTSAIANNEGLRQPPLTVKNGQKKANNSLDQRTARLIHEKHNQFIIEGLTNKGWSTNDSVNLGSKYSVGRHAEVPKQRKHSSVILDPIEQTPIGV